MRSRISPQPRSAEPGQIYSMLIAIGHGRSEIIYTIIYYRKPLHSRIEQSHTHTVMLIHTYIHTYTCGWLTVKRMLLHIGHRPN